MSFQGAIQDDLFGKTPGRRFFQMNFPDMGLYIADVFSDPIASLSSTKMGEVRIIKVPETCSGPQCKLKNIDSP